MSSYSVVQYGFTLTQYGTIGQVDIEEYQARSLQLVQTTQVSLLFI